MRQVEEGKGKEEGGRAISLILLATSSTGSIVAAIYE